MGGKRRTQSVVTPLRLTPTVAERRIRDLASLSDNVIIGLHALERMKERDIFTSDVFDVLRSGFVEGQPEKTDRSEWKCKMVKQLRGGREAGVITIILHENKLFIKTVEWEDLK